MNIEIANRLVELRKQKGLSQEELADKLGISRQAVSKWERAEAGPDVDNAIRLSRLYGVSLDELFGNKPDYERAIEALRLQQEAAEGAEDAPEPGSADAFGPAQEEPDGSASVPPHVPDEGGESYCGIDSLILDGVRANVRIGRSADGAVHIKTEGPEEERRRCRVSIAGSRMTVLTRLDGVLFGGQTISIITHGMQDVETLQTLVARINIAGNVAEGMSYMQTCSRRIGKHIEHIELGTGIVNITLVGVMITPILLPLFLYFFIVIIHFLSSNFLSIEFLE